MDNKYTLSEVTEEEKESFMSEFNALCEKHSINASTMPRYESILLKDEQGKERISWITVDALILQKKILKKEGGPVNGAGIPGEKPTVDPVNPQPEA